MIQTLQEGNTCICTIYIWGKRSQIMIDQQIRNTSHCENLWRIGNNTRTKSYPKHGNQEGNSHSNNSSSEFLKREMAEIWKLV